LVRIAMAMWIFLRGLSREASHWGGFAVEFERAIPQAQVLAMDLPGNGALRHIASPLSIAQLVIHCREELQRRGIPPPYHVLAVSMGAMVAAQWACDAPAEIAAAVMINTSFKPFSPFHARLRPENYGRLLRMMLPGTSAQTLETTVLELTSNAPKCHKNVLPQWVGIRQSNPVTLSNTLRQLVAAARYRAPARRPESPVLLLGSSRDKLVNVQCMHDIARHWNCALALHPQAGHDLPLDDPQWVIQKVSEWLTENVAFSPATFA
jgi:pimeloyl-ACP methyl ester carboxylesterase